jgi:hypothetical protein
MVQTELCKIAAKWGTDKVPSIGHSYTPYYHELLKGKTVRRMLEIGIGYPELMEEYSPGYITGASLFMWEEYFPEAEIYGLDNNPQAMVNKGRIRSLLCDQGSEVSLHKAASELGGRMDLIIDDGSHNPEHQVLSAKVLIPLLLDPKGIYVIEDVRAPNQVTCQLPYKCEVQEFPEGTGYGGNDRLIIIRGNQSQTFYNPVRRQAAYNGLLLAKRLLEGLGVEFWLCAGTLLGAVREKDLIAHDSDLDLGTWAGRPEQEEGIRQAFEENGLRVSNEFGVQGQPGHEYAFSLDGTHLLDIFFFTREGDRCWSALWVDGVCKKGWFPLITNLSTLEFLGEKFPVPANYEDILIAEYGKDWRTPELPLEMGGTWHWETGPRCVER